MEQAGRSQLVQGVYAALATPLRKNAVEPDAAAFLDYADVVARAGVDGAVLFGATGEFIHFDLASRSHTLNLVMKRSRIPVLVNVSHSTLDGALMLAEDAIDMGASGVLIMAPYFFKYTDNDLEEFFQRFAQQISERAPVYLYNLPQFGNGLSAELAVRLLSSGLFAGIKDSSGNWDLFQTLRTLHSSRSFQLLAGNERIYLHQQRAGGVDGIVSGVSAALPELVIAIERFGRAQNMTRAAQLDGYLQEFLDRVDAFPAPVAIKQAAAMRGWLAENFALPFSAQTADQLAQYRDWLKEWIPFVLKECKRA